MKARKQAKKQKRRKVSATTHLTPEARREATGAEPRSEATARVTSARTTAGTSLGRATDTKSLVFGASCAKNERNDDERTNGNGSGITDKETNIGEMGAAAAFASAATLADARGELTYKPDPTRPWKKGRRIGRPGQAVTDPLHSHGKLDDAIQEKILHYIAVGTSWAEAAQLCGINRSTSNNWRTRGQAYLDDPSARPEDARYGEFYKAVEHAEMSCKAWVVNKILRSDDWRAWRFWLINRDPKNWKSEHVRTEISGIDGAAIPVSVTSQPFKVELHLSGGPAPEWKVVDHRTPEQIERETVVAAHVESQVIEAPEIAAPAEVKAPEELNPFDPLGPRLWEKGLRS